MLEKIVKRVIGGRHLNRSINQEKGLLNSPYVLESTYLLKHKYSYDEVIALNDLTGWHCTFGYCEEMGPVAFIGMFSVYFCTRSGYFEYNIHEYGTSRDESTYYFKVYSRDDAKKVKKFTVYGGLGLEEVARKVPIEKMQYNFDKRYTCKKDMDNNPDKKIIEMDLKLLGTYNFFEARLLATGTTEDKIRFTGEEHPIQFAIVNEEMYVGIINLWEYDDSFQFRDVWEYGCEEPKIQKIRFLSDEEAKNIKNFSLYVYICPYSLKTKVYPIEKMDRTFNPKFKFQLPDGTDYRLS